MQFSLTAEQEDLRSAVAELLADRAPLAVTRALVDAGKAQDQDAWRALVDMGVAAVDIAEERAGTGLGAVELAVVMEQAGVVLYPGPLLSTTGFAAGLLDGDDEASAALAARVSEGLVLAAVVTERPAPWTADAVTFSARSSPAGWRLTGTGHAIAGAASADLLLVAARTDEGDVALFSLPRLAADVVGEPSLDPSRALTRVAFRDTVAELVLRSAEDRIHRAGLRAATALAAESVGASRAALDMTSAYVKTRTQFGQAVGSFQVVKHRLADLLVEVELAHSAVYLAACHLDAGDFDAASVSAPLALHSATTCLQRAGATAVQLHGGMGFTWESACHWFVTWGDTSRSLLGSDSARLEDVYQRAHLMAP